MDVSHDPTRRRLTLTGDEESLFRVLLDTIEHFRITSTLRVAGGWVRDKLMGRSSDDIDIALDSMMGAEFAEKVNAYLETRGIPTHRIGVIHANPDQSKHLETAKVRVMGVWVDFVNLRRETYSEDSRIPDIMLGSAQEDAFRRDLTINSLFYNINEDMVEDWTGHGLEDLEMGIIRTPLEPQSTFYDDPLRVLRSIRFAARFQFSIDPELQRAAMEDSVKDSLLRKISRERILAELDGMLAGPRPFLALRLIHEFELGPIVFAVPSEHDCWKFPHALCPQSGLSDSVLFEYAINLVFQISRMSESGFLPLDDQSKENMRHLYLSAYLYPFCETNCRDSKNRPETVCRAMTRDSLKMRTKDVDEIERVASSISMLPVFVERLLIGELSRVDVARWLSRVGEHWEYALCVLKAAELMQLGGLFSLHEMQSPDFFSLSENERSLIDKLRGLRSFIHEQNLIGVWSLRPLLNGKEISELLNVPCGPQTGIHLQLLLEEQWRNPEMTKENARIWCIENIST